MRLELSSEMGTAALTRLLLCPPPGLHACVLAENLCIGHHPDVISARHPAHLSAPPLCRARHAAAAGLLQLDAPRFQRLCARGE